MASNSAHRDFIFRQGHVMSGDDGKAFQRAYNRLAGIGKRKGKFTSLKVDGEIGRQTIAQGRRMARSLGLVLHQEGLTVGTQRVVRHPRLRNPVQLLRARKWLKAHAKDKAKPAGVGRDGNTVSGGSPRQRMSFALSEAARLYTLHPGSRFYSMPGFWDVNHAITGEPHGARSDCSQFGIAISHSAQVADPAGTAFKFGNTDTIRSHCHEITRQNLRVGDPILYFNLNGGTHHVEWYYGDGHHTYAELAAMGSPLRDVTIGHGSPPVDRGDIDMIARPRFFRHAGLD